MIEEKAKKKFTKVLKYLKKNTQDEAEWNLSWLCYQLNERYGFQLKVVRIDLLADLISNRIKLARELGKTKKLLEEKEEIIKNLEENLIDLKEITQNE